MKVLVSGSRSIYDYDFVGGVLNELPWSVDTLIHGDARGVDTMANAWAETENYPINRIDIEVHPIPEWVWEQYGSSAGPKRNTYMIEQADAVVAIWDGESNGTKDTVQKAEAAGMPLRKVVVDIDSDGNVTDIVLDKLKESDQTKLVEFEHE